MKRWLFAGVVALSLIGSACQQQAQEPKAEEKMQFEGVNLTFSISLEESEKATIQKLLDFFEKDSGAKVTLTSVTAADMPQKLKVEVDAGRPTIHLFAQDNLALAPLVKDGLVEDLSDVEIPSAVVQSMIPPKFEGKQYFLPFRPNVRIAYVNKDRFAKAGVQAPKTVEELQTVAAKLKAAGGTGKVTLSLAEGDPAAVTISEWIVSYGGNPLILNDEGSIQAFTTLRALWKDGVLAKESLQGKFDTEVDNLQGETAWLAQNWPFTSARLAEQGLLEKFQVYEGWDGPKQGAHVVGGDVLGIPKGVSGKQKEAAIELAKSLMDRPSQETLAKENAWPSIRTDAYGQVPSEQKETFEAIQKALEDGWYRPGVVYWSDVSEQLNAAIDRIIEKGEDPRKVLDELHGKIETAAKAKGGEYPPTSTP